jgi:hypothetical protein
VNIPSDSHVSGVVVVVDGVAVIAEKDAICSQNVGPTSFGFARTGAAAKFSRRCF